MNKFTKRLKNIGLFDYTHTEEWAVLISAEGSAFDGDSYYRSYKITDVSADTTILLRVNFRDKKAFIEVNDDKKIEIEFPVDREKLLQYLYLVSM